MSTIIRAVCVLALLWGLPLSDAYKILSEATGGVYCAGAATMLSGVDKAAGFNSWLYNFGVVDGPTHETTLVEVNREVIRHYSPKDRVP